MSVQLPYKVFWGTQAKAALQQYAITARQLGIHQELARLIRALDEALGIDPQSVGEIYHRQGNIEEYLAVRDFLSLDYAVDSARKVVQVRKCIALSSRGL